MTIDTNTLTTFSQIGIREDLLDVIFNISPTETPFMGNIGKVKAAQVYHEWETDILAAASTSNAALEGDAFAAQALAQPTRIGNSTQISNKEVQVSRTAMQVRVAGQPNPFAYYTTKKAKELKRDMEAILTSNNIPVPQSGASNTVARQTRPLTGWYQTNVVGAGSGGANGTTTTARTDGSTQSALSQINVDTALQQCYTAGGAPNMIMVSPGNKRNFSGFAGPTGTQRWNEAEKKVLTTSIDVYRSDFGEVAVQPNRFQRFIDVHVLDTDYWALATLSPFAVVPIARDGDSERCLLVVEYALQASNEAASALVADTNATS